MLVYHLLTKYGACSQVSDALHQGGGIDEGSSNVVEDASGVLSERTMHVKRFLRQQCRTPGVLVSRSMVHAVVDPSPSRKNNSRSMVGRAACGDMCDTTEGSTQVMSSSDFLQGHTKREAACFFFEMLLLNNKQFVHLHQPEKDCFGDIFLQPTAKLRNS